MQAALYQTDFRPVPLEEYIKVGNTIYNKKMDIVRTISKQYDLGGKDPDHIVELCNEVGSSYDTSFWVLSLSLNNYKPRECISGCSRGSFSIDILL
jgi:hypothetical protein